MKVRDFPYVNKFAGISKKFVAVRTCIQTQQLVICFYPDNYALLLEKIVLYCEQNLLQHVSLEPYKFLTRYNIFQIM